MIYAQYNWAYPNYTQYIHVLGAVAEKKDDSVIWDKTFDELSAFVTRFNDSVMTEFTDFPTFAWPTIPRRFIRKELETDKRLLNRL